jgi:predicted transglutaminase-like cysteine proteinase
MIATAMAMQQDAASQGEKAAVSLVGTSSITFRPQFAYSGIAGASHELETGSLGLSPEDVSYGPQPMPDYDPLQIAPLGDLQPLTPTIEPQQQSSVDHNKKAISSGGPEELKPDTAKPSIARMQFSTPALAPMAHTAFCFRYPRDCKSEKIIFRGGAISMTPQRWNELVRVNGEVNRSIVFERNLGGLAAEKWLISPKTGECHDYAVTKRHELIALGWPERALLLSEVVTSWGEHHLVLVVRSHEGDFVADNLNPQIRTWVKAPYQWVRIQSPQNPKFWFSVANATT